MILLAETGAIRYTGTPVLLLGVVTGMWWAVVASRREDNLRVVARKHWVLAIVFIVVLINPARTSIGELSRDIKRGLATAGAMPEPISHKAVQKVQQVVPAGSLILARMGQAYFLDFSRNPIWHLDMPGASSLPPGLPLNKNVDAVRAYFRQCGIRYVMYSEIDDGGHEVAHFAELVDYGAAWDRISAYNIVAFDKLIRAMGTVAEIIYRKDGLVVFDLDTRAGTPQMIERDRPASQQ
jgi:hypothetical protein